MESVEQCNINTLSRLLDSYGAAVRYLLVAVQNIQKFVLFLHNFEKEKHTKNEQVFFSN